MPASLYLLPFDLATVRTKLPLAIDLEGQEAPAISVNTGGICGLVYQAASRQDGAMPGRFRYPTYLRVLVGVTAAVAAWLFGTSMAVPDTMTLFVTGDTRGLLEPCGCRRDQAGGLAGRAARIREDASGERVVVDCGNLIAGVTPGDLVKLRYLSSAMRTIGYGAVNAGPSEVKLGREALLKLGRDLPMTSCSVVDAGTGVPLLPTYRIIRAAGLRFAIIGTVDPAQCDPGAGLRIRPPLEALADTVPRAKADADIVIVLLWAPPDQAGEVAKRFREVRCVAAGDRLYASAEAERVSHAEVLEVADRGKVLGRITYHRHGGDLAMVSSAVMRVPSQGSGDPRIAQILADYRAELRRADEPMAPVADADRVSNNGIYAGPGACASCHAGASRVLALSKHRGALETLVRVGRDHDPECLVCHTTGYGTSNGYVSQRRTPIFSGVQCEACHGPAGAHVASRGKAPLRPATPGTCVRCHDRENSTAFDYPGYWPRIAHGLR